MQTKSSLPNTIVKPALLSNIKISHQVCNNIKYQNKQSSTIISGCEQYITSYTVGLKACVSMKLTSCVASKI